VVPPPNSKVDPPSLELYLRPGDPYIKSIPGRRLKTNNVLVQLTVPKRTGRKRKRGATEWEDAPENNGIPSPTQQPGRAEYVMRSLRDNTSKYEMRAVGAVESTHRFRVLPDFAFATTGSEFVQKMNRTLVTTDYEKIKEFKFDMSKGLKPNIDLPPPTMLTHFTLPFNYAYKQNVSIKTAVDTSGNVTLINEGKGRKIMTIRIAYDAPTVPMSPPEGVAPIETLDLPLRRLYETLQDLFLQRPVWVRRALRNEVEGNVFTNQGKHVIYYIGYMFLSGPWKDAIIRYGVDPRKDVKYRIYQTLTFQLEGNQDKNERAVASEKGQHPNRSTAPQKRGVVRRGPDWENPQRPRKDSIPNTSHIFDGKVVYLDGKTWQVCDVTDPVVKGILDTKELRKECHLKIDGWYHNGTWAKARVIMRARIMQLLAGIEPKDSDWKNIVKFPEIIMREGRDVARFDKFSGATSQEMDRAAVVRSMASFSDETYSAAGTASRVVEEGDDALMLDPRLSEVVSALAQAENSDEDVDGDGEFGGQDGEVDDD
jgi:general transcription factor 3C polypeptide 5 (transcription factor C subunit 1)